MNIEQFGQQQAAARAIEQGIRALSEAQAAKRIGISHAVDEGLRALRLEITKLTGDPPTTSMAGLRDVMNMLVDQSVIQMDKALVKRFGDNHDMWTRMADSTWGDLGRDVALTHFWPQMQPRLTESVRKRDERIAAQDAVFLNKLDPRLGDVLPKALPAPVPERSMSADEVLAGINARQNRKGQK